MMYGRAIRAEQLSEIRQLIPDHFLLVPGVGAQGGDLEAVVKYGINSQAGLLINSSRAIIYASTEEDLPERAGQEARKVSEHMEELLQQYYR